MAFSLDEIVPWGRSFDEYTEMFGLTAADLSGRILGCGDGPASFNAEATRRGHSVISCDPIYRFSAAQIERRIHEVYDSIQSRQQIQNQTNQPMKFVPFQIRCCAPKTKDQCPS